MTAASAGAPAPAAFGGTWPEELVGELALVALDRVDSTQRLARTYVERLLDDDEEPMPFALLALEQTAGRGRGGRAWASAPGMGLWASVALRVSAERLQALPMRTGVALAECVNRIAADACRIKWPNDLICRGRKLGGILIDAVSRPAGACWAVIGVGIDHGHAERELPTPAATSLRMVAGEEAAGALPAFAADCLASLWRELARAESGWLARYRALSAHVPGEAISCVLPGETVAGRFTGFDEHGFLVLETGAGPRTLRTGEVFAW